MIQAALNDVFQRVMTRNKYEQKARLRSRIAALRMPEGSKVLDFGCGTALFATVFRDAKYVYCGYDIDGRLIAYASRIYDHGRFTDSKTELRKESPFDIILANCCFHHIDDMTLAEELGQMKTLMKPEGILIMIDILLPRDDTFLPRKLFRTLERGAYIRSQEDYRSILERQFLVRKSDIERSHLFSIQNFPIYNDLAVFECEARGGCVPRVHGIR
jgi:SAM-dependent methyltransferase